MEGRRRRRGWSVDSVVMSGREGERDMHATREGEGRNRIFEKRRNSMRMCIEKGGRSDYSE